MLINSVIMHLLLSFTCFTIKIMMIMDQFIALQSVSKDSDSLITEEQENSYDPSMPWWHHPKVRENWKMVLAAFCLLLIGLGMFGKHHFYYTQVVSVSENPGSDFKILLSIAFVGLAVAGVVIVSLPINGLQGAVFFIAGVICFIPGAYHVIYIYCAVKGKRGYDFYHLPLFN